MYNKARATRVALPAIDYMEILHQLANSTYETPHLPPTLYKLANPMKPGPASQQTMSTASMSHSSLSSGAGSDMSSLTTPMTITQKSGRGTFQANTAHINRNLQTLVPSNLTFKLLISETILPLSEDARQNHSA